MRQEPNTALDKFRRIHPTCGNSPNGASWGYFVIEDKELHIVSSGSLPAGLSDVTQWEHVSVHHPRRCPTWGEMDRVKRMFWKDEETVVQFHVSGPNKVNVHPYCLHLWRKVGCDFELPPKEAL